MSAFIRTVLIESAFAQGGAPPPAPCDFVSGGFGAPGSMFMCGVNYLAMMTYAIIVLSASLSLVMLMVNGFRYMVGPAFPGGSSDAAKKGITASLTGLVLSLLTYILLDTLVAAVTQ